MEKKTGPADFTEKEPFCPITDSRSVVFGDRKLVLNTPIFEGKFKMNEAIPVPLDVVYWD